MFIERGIPWAKTSLRPLSIQRSAVPFCQGLQKPIRLGLILLESRKSVPSVPNFASRSNTAYRYGQGSENASLSFCEIPKLGVSQDIEVEDSVPTMFDDKEAIQDSKGDGGNGKEVHGCDVLAVITQEGSPGLPCVIGRNWGTNIARHGTLRTIESEFRNLAVDPRSPPRGTLPPHLLDEKPESGLDLGPAGILFS